MSNYLISRTVSDISNYLISLFIQWHTFLEQVMITLENIGTINPVIMRENPPEKYIQIVTIDGHDFWFMGFVNFEKALHNLLSSVSDFRAAQAVLDGRWLHSLLDPLSSSKFWRCSVCYCFLFAWMYKRQQFVCLGFVIHICPFHLVF